MKNNGMKEFFMKIKDYFSSSLGEAVVKIILLAFWAVGVVTIPIVNFVEGEWYFAILSILVALMSTPVAFEWIDDVRDSL